MEPSVSKSKLHEEGCDCAPEKGSASAYSPDAVIKSACVECKAGKPCTCLDKGVTKSFKDNAVIKKASSEIYSSESLESADAPVVKKMRKVIGDEGKEIAPGALPSPEPSQYKEYAISGIHALYRILAIIVTCVEKIVEMIERQGWLSNETVKKCVDSVVSGLKTGLEYLKKLLNKAIDLLHGDRKLVSPPRHISS